MDKANWDSAKTQPVEIIDFMIDPQVLGGIDDQTFATQLETRLIEEFPGVKVRIHRGVTLGPARVTMADWRLNPKVIEERVCRIATTLIGEMGALASKAGT